MGKVFYLRPGPHGPLWVPVPKIDPTGFNNKTPERSPFGFQRPDHGVSQASSSAPTSGSLLYTTYIYIFMTYYILRQPEVYLFMLDVTVCDAPPNYRDNFLKIT